VRSSRAAVTATVVLVLCIATGGGRIGSEGHVAALQSSRHIADAWSDSLIHADAARAAGYIGKGVTVAVLDTGIDTGNPDLAGAVVAEHCIVPPDGCPDGTGEQDGPGSAADDQGHGTAMAGIIAGRGTGGATIGVAPDAQLVSVKVADRNGVTSAAQIVAGLDWVLNHEPGVKIVNVSLGSSLLLNGPCDDLSGMFSAYTEAVDALHAHGTMVFASSGNGGSAVAMTAPACVQAAVAVGAVYGRAFGPYLAPYVCRDKTTAPDQIACFSDGGSQLDLLAVGAPFDVSDLDPANPLLAGTSAASAQAAGAAAVLLQADPTLTGDQVEQLLKDTGVPIYDARNHLTTPRIDLAAALGRLLGHAMPLLPPPADAGGTGSPGLSAPTLPAVDVSTARISFGPVKLGREARRVRIVRNSGTGTLTVRVSTTLGAVAARPEKVRIPPGEKATVVLTFRPARRGTYRGRLRLVTDDPAARLVALPLTGSGT
jgi:subtilisin family serine protease